MVLSVLGFICSCTDRECWSWQKTYTVWAVFLGVSSILNRGVGANLRSSTHRLLEQSSKSILGSLNDFGNRAGKSGIGIL
jgi:hypothetical protein